MTITDPHELMELYIKDRTGEKAKSTIYKDRDHLNQFCNWCEEQGIESVQDIDGSHFLEYKFHLRQRIADSTIRNHFSTLRTFFKFCKRIDATDGNQELHTKLETPDFAKGDLSRDDMMDFNEVKKLLAYFDKFEYATVKHAMFVVFWHTGCRRGALRGLDLEDYKPVQERENGRYGLIRFKHRPESGTPLKNKENGEREVIIWPQHGEIIEDYIEMKRRDKVDEYSRKPLFTGPNGRYSASNIQAFIYAISRPCYYTNVCPHNRDMDDCEARYYEKASKCPSSISPHPMRRASITYHLEEKDWTYEASSGRFDVSVDVLKEHYDQSTDEGRRKTRASMFFNGDQGVL
ncbi:tyrosine-type recombinase/integrase [Natronoglomus mannanivorans]|uniref:Phage integrase N-terminal SAM-like domain-containing protein n=1 Tax=Natronoglomus mannanivorans TaxID=2979990 RepID=A0AAP3E2F9_9EURY|nr:phage integrase N-terminal SAM-like domain-containing protein [Halobacteria archaeon AArc-xg1-1]